MTASYLRPDPETLGREWREIVEAEYEQVERLREWRDTDFYRPIASHFTDDPYRSGDDILDTLRSFGDEDTVWLDIGAGAGRYALPLAVSGKQVIAVDPSEGMQEALRSEIERYGLENIEQRGLRWPEGAEDIQADISLAAHVGYDIREINAFVDGMERATRQRCVALLMDRAPSGGFEGLWAAVHGERKTPLPAMPEFVHLLLARGATPEIRIFPRQHEPWTEEELRASARRRLWLSEGSEKDRRLQALLDEEIREGTLDFDTPTRIAMISWHVQ